MRILYVNSYYYPDEPGGAEVILRVLAEGMAKSGHTVAVLSSRDVDKDYVVSGVQVYSRNMGNFYWKLPSAERDGVQKLLWHALDSFNIRAGSVFDSVIDEFSPDIIVTHNLSGISIDVWRRAKSRNIPIIHVLHDYYLICPSVTMRKACKNCIDQCLSCGFFRLPHASMSRIPNAVVGVSEFILDRHKKTGLFEGVKGLVINNARFMPVRDACVSVSQGGRPLVFGFIGGLTEVKGIEDLLNAFLDLLVDEPSVRLHIAGVGAESYVQQLRIAALRAGDAVEFVGRVPAVEFLRSIDVLVVPSVWSDPFPGVVYEALSQSIPVIGANNGGIPEIIKSEVNGLVYDACSKRALYEAMLRLTTSPATVKLFASNARTSVESLLDEGRFLQQHLDLMEETLRQHSSGGV